MSISRLTLALLATILAVPIAAAPVIRPLGTVGYDMPNGSGVASGGDFNHWDLFYNGEGNTMVDGAPLFGGTGELTDEAIASGPAAVVEGLSGFGPWTGWAATTTLSPELAFRFPVTADGGFLVVTSVDLHLDNSRIGRAFSPTAILINGAALPFVAPAPGTIGWVSLVTPFKVNTRTDATIRVQLVHDPAPDAGWIFASEIRFNGFRAGAPEPGTWAMMITGFGLVGAAMRRRNPRPGGRDRQAPGPVYFAK